MAAVECKICQIKAYPLEAVVIDGEVYHKGCFKCKECGTTLTAGKCAMINGVPYCKPHFKQLFAEKGSYDFGGQNPNHKQWEKVNYTPGLSIDAAVISDASKSASSTPLAVGHSRSLSSMSPSPMSRPPSGSIAAAAAPAFEDGAFQELLTMIEQNDVAIAKTHVRKHGVQILFKVDASGKTPVELAFTKKSELVGAAFVTLLQQHIQSLEVGKSYISVIPSIAEVAEEK